MNTSTSDRRGSEQINRIYHQHIHEDPPSSSVGCGLNYKSGLTYERGLICERGLIYMRGPVICVTRQPFALDKDSSDQNTID